MAPRIDFITILFVTFYYTGYIFTLNTAHRRAIVEFNCLRDYDLIASAVCPHNPKEGNLTVAPGILNCFLKKWPSFSIKLWAAIIVLMETISAETSGLFEKQPQKLFPKIGNVASLFGSRVDRSASRWSGRRNEGEKGQLDRRL